MTLDPGLFRRSRTPIYLQIAKLLRQKIEHGEWRVGQCIPTLEQLMATYGAARSTLREALAQLENEGAIRRSRGAGTFVTKDLSTERWFKLPTDWDDMVASVAGLRVRLLPIGRTTGRVLPAVDFIDGERADSYRYLRRVHYRQDVAYCLIDIWLERGIFARDPKAFMKAPVLTRLANLTGLAFTGAKQVVRIAVSDADTAALLDIGVGDPIADVRRAVTDGSGRIVYYAHIRYPARLIEIEINLMRRHGRGEERKNNNHPCAGQGSGRRRSWTQSPCG